MLALNLRSYAGGKDLTRSGAVDAGLFEVCAVTDIMQLNRAMAASSLPAALGKCCALTVLARTNCLRLKFVERLHLQVDGEPWRQPPSLVQSSFFGRSTVLRREK